MTNEHLVALIRVGENTAENMFLLYNQNRGLIYTIARKYTGMAELDDLAQEGYIGLCSAVDGYKQACGCSFSTYAYKCIQRQMWQHVSQRKQFNENTVSLDITIGGEDGEITLEDTIASSEDMEADTLEDIQQEQLKAELWKAVDSLPENQPDILRKRCQESMTRKQTGEAIGISESAVRTAELKAFRTLRESRYGLQHFLDDGIRNAGMHGTGVARFNNTWTSATERVAIYGR